MNYAIQFNTRPQKKPYMYAREQCDTHFSVDTSHNIYVYILC